MFIMVISKKINEGLSYDLKRKCHDKHKKVYHDKIFRL